MSSDSQMREATEAWYLLDHPGDADGATVAGYLAALRVARRVDPHAIPVQHLPVRVAMQKVDIVEIETWLAATWGDIAGTIVDIEVIA